jgi:hypothetical protein
MTSQPVADRGKQVAAKAAVQSTKNQVVKVEAVKAEGKPVSTANAGTPAKQTNQTKQSAGPPRSRSKADAPAKNRAQDNPQNASTSKDSGTSEGGSPKTDHGNQPESSKRSRATSSGKASRPKPAVPIDVGAKARIDAAEVSVVISNQESETDKVDVNEFRSFVAQNRSTKRATVKPKRDSRKDQLMMAGLVIGMLLLLAIVLIIAKSFVTRGDEAAGAKERVNESAIAEWAANPAVRIQFENSLENGYHETRIG